MRSHFGRYRVLQKLGQGAMSAVFLARDPVLSRLVAIKVLHQDLALHRPILDRFFKEAKIAARIRSPHVVEVYDFGQEGRHPYLVMEFIDGRSLQKVLDQLNGRPLDSVVAASLVCQAAEGLAMAAETGVVHRDLKPENLMLSERGYLKITDFGISHLAEHTVTRTGQVLGSPRFMSPEQVMGIKPITFQSDMFSLGAVLFYFLSGRTPFQAETVPELHRQITEEPHLSLLQVRPDADPILSLLVDVLLQKNPAKRGEGPRWLLIQLRTYLHSKRVIDPVERAAGFVQDLSAQGIQTTCNLDRDAVRKFMGSFELNRPTSHRTTHRGLVVAFLSIAVVLAAGLAAIFWLRGLSKPALPVREESSPHQAITAKTQQRATAPTGSAATADSSRNPNLDSLGTEALSKGQDQVSNSLNPTKDEEGDAVLSIYSIPEGAAVTIDGYEYGKTPLEARFLPAGSYRVVLRSESGLELDTVLSLPAGPHVHRFTLASNLEDYP